MNNILPRVTDNGISIELRLGDVRIAGAHANVLSLLGRLGLAVGSWIDMGGWQMAALVGAEGTIVREGAATTALLVGVA